MFLYSYFSFSCGINIKIVNYNSNNMGNRSRTEIVAMILDAANKGGETKTKIMYFAFLSYNQLNEYLSILIENNLIEYLDGTRRFKTTTKGLFFLKMHNELAELLQQTTFENN
jgi:predicted transcriptional regulator